MKSGDRVKTKQDLLDGQIVGGLMFIESMRTEKTEVIGKYGPTLLYCTNKKVYHPDMLEIIKKK